jgi:glycosyltransferase involved in cell wall biosynthesis
MFRGKSVPVQIGMPVYNGAKFIESALRSLSSQSFQDWELLIADNASVDATEEICRGYVEADDRIRYFRHEDNIGAPSNFKWLLDHATAPYFMWAAADDIWGPEFVSSCYSRLSAQRDCGMAFTGLDVIDSFGQVIRHCSDIPNFAGAPNWSTVARYVWSPEFHGKANLIYSLFRTSICKDAYRRFPFTLDWGGDMCFNLAAMTMGSVDVIGEVHFYKRDSREGDQLGAPRNIVIPEGLLERSCPLQFFPGYTKDMLKAVRGTRFYPLVGVAMSVREWRLRRLAGRA